MNPVQNEKGEWIIPASRRPDGTWRKEKLLKEGYVPQDEIRAFETRASKQTKKGIPGLPPPTEKSKPKLKSSEPRTKAGSKPDTIEAAISASADSMAKVVVSDMTASAQTPDATERDPKKRLKALKKKLRDIVELSSKNITDLSSEQKEKLDKKESIEAEILSLAEFDK